MLLTSDKKFKNELRGGIGYYPILYIPHFDHHYILECINELYPCEHLECCISRCISDVAPKKDYTNFCLEEIVKLCGCEGNFNPIRTLIVNKEIIENSEIQVVLNQFTTDNKTKKNKYTIILIATDRCLPPAGILGCVKVINIKPPIQEEIEVIIKNKIQDASRQDITNLARKLLGLQRADILSITSLIESTIGCISSGAFVLVENLKKEIIAKSGILEIVEPNETLDDIGGVGKLVEDIKNVGKLYRNLDVIHEASINIPIPKGFLLIGMPGCGKSMIAKATANELRLPLLRMDMSKILGNLVGDSEQNMRHALEIVDSTHPCVLWIDEIEKAFAGTSNASSNNDELMLRLMGIFLTWMQERKSAVFIVATANDVMKPEFMRKGRFDEVYFVDFPDREERKQIIEKSIGKYGKKIETALKNVISTDRLADILGNDRGRWLSGAEIKSLLDTIVQKKLIDLINKTESEKSNTASKKLNIVFEKNDFDANNEIVKSFLNSAMASQSRKLKEKSEWDKIKGDTSQLGFIDRIYSVKEIYGFTDAHMTNFQNK
jgi:ATP-dependent 26S proteasome regulatory subunit